jgi:hypothetical protein
MSDDLWLALMSLALVLPVMIAVLFVALTGRLGRSEDARYLPIMDPERDFWDIEDDAASPGPASKEGGQVK